MSLLKLNLTPAIDDSTSERGRSFESDEISSAVTLLPSRLPEGYGDESAIWNLPTPSANDLEAAVRLKVLLGELGSVVAVGGIAENDGFTSLTINLAIALATIGTSRVLIIDANANGPRMNDIFSLTAPSGLTDVLREAVSLESAVRRIQLDNLFFLSFGQTDSLPILLSRSASKRLFEDIRRNFRYVLIGTGIIRGGPAALLLASMTDGVVAAVAAGARKREEVIQFGKELKQLSIPLLGVVLTTQN